MTRIIIVGGGTAGWLAACTLASSKKRLAVDELAITVIDAPELPPIGVGEGTWPTMRNTLSGIGLDEQDVIAACDGSLKQGSRFDGWLSGAIDDCYYHPFTPPPEGRALDLVAAWMELASDLPFAEAVCPQPALCAAGLAPRQSEMPPYAGALNYAYHLDAAKLGAILAHHAVSRLGVTHLREVVTDAEPAESGDVAALRTRSGQRIEGDLFIDCTGTAALLIGNHYGTEWIDCGHTLPNDRALVVQVPVDRGSAIESQTIGTAHAAGWLWDIGLPTRRGVGCVYSSQFMDDDAADSVLRDYVSRIAGESAASALKPRLLSFRSGHRAEFWRGNCIAIGLSAGFIEPLEASAIVMIELSLRALIENFPVNRGAMPFHARRFNELFRTHWQRVIEFLKLHYVLSRRSEPYWRAHRDPTTMPSRLVDLIELWRDQPPTSYDLPLAEEIFPAASYQYVYYGMGGAVPGRLPAAEPSMRRQVSQVRERVRGLSSALPTNRTYVDRVHADAAQTTGGRV